MVQQCKKHSKWTTLDEETFYKICLRLSGVLSRYLLTEELVAAENPKEFDPRKFMIPAMDEMQKLVKDRFERFGTAGNAAGISVIPMDDMAKRYADGSLDPQIA